jgi:predicted nuclease with TOPRIM domain
MDKEAFKTKVNEIIDDLSEKIDALKAAGESAEDAVVEEYGESLEELESQKERLEEKLEKLEDISDETWEELKEKFASASDSFKEGLARIADYFS